VGRAKSTKHIILSSYENPHDAFGSFVGKYPRIGKQLQLDGAFPMNVVTTRASAGELPLLSHQEF
jgi:hypothetical protein